VGPGQYEGPFEVKKSVDIVGVGAAKDIVLFSKGVTTLHWLGVEGSLQNITIKQNYFCTAFCAALYIENSSPKICGSSANSDGGRSITVYGSNADPVIYNNSVGPSKFYGVDVDEKASATIESNEIFKSRYSGIAVLNESIPSILRNSIHNNVGEGILVEGQSAAHIEGNTISENEHCNMSIRQSVAKIQENTIKKAKYCGITIEYQAQIVARDNSIFENGTTGIYIDTQLVSKFQNNRVYENATYGVYVSAGGTGEFSKNTIENNKERPWFLAPNAGRIVYKTD
jgi:parallel beta-helix repeat protein